MSLDPPSPVGIETVAFELLFSQAMNQGNYPNIDFYSTKKDALENFNASNSSLPNNIGDVAIYQRG